MIMYGLLCLAVIFSTTVMMYISMAVPIGPWIGPTLVLFVVPLVKLLSKKKDVLKKTVNVVAGGSIGGIMATAIGFTLPTLCFADHDAFMYWLQAPYLFVFSMGFFTLAAGLIGYIVADRVQDEVFDEQKLSFPIGLLMFQAVNAHDNPQQSKEIGFSLTLSGLFSVAQDYLYGLGYHFVKSFSLTPAFSISYFFIPAIICDVWPMVWSIGFIAGHLMAIPLFIGMVLKIFVLSPVHNYCFSMLSIIDFMLSFCSGIVVAGTASGLWRMVKKININSLCDKARLRFFVDKIEYNAFDILLLIVGIVFLFGIFIWWDFSLFSGAFIIFCTLLCAYQLVLIGGAIGLAPLGRFATFVMVPAMLLFELNAQHLVLLSLFVQVSGGVAVDVLFGRKMAQLARCDMRDIRLAQIVGVILSAFVAAAAFYWLVNCFTLGSDQLFAYKAQMRALLLNVHTFRFDLVVYGAMMGLLLKQFKCNPALVLGGILMPINLIIGLLFGAGIAKLVGKVEQWSHVASGIFSGASLWMLIRGFVGF